ncbi:MAG: Fe-Mn family superoxide dismutase [Candidatus Peregrinibacteria bacterium]|nr:Fe-Mn family superoxide dismutase [Candidatus Peregrinibacteria bacterium]MDZ4244678.1 Fe-Mn family superoxide dismutase [Candidatus Gracilibacteria bacterium]
MYTQKDYSYLLGTPGFSDTLLNNHFKLYAGYVNATNTLIDKLRAGTYAAGTPEYNELTRRFGWEYNGMRLHELYFGNMKNGGTPLGDGSLKTAIESTWGSLENWQKDFLSIGGMRGIGWVVLSWDRDQNALFNVWINEHDTGHLAGATPLLVMDVFEHAFITDYALSRADYMSAFMNAIDWSVADARLI